MQYTIYKSLINVHTICVLAGLYTSDIVNYRRRCKTAKVKEYKVCRGNDDVVCGLTHSQAMLTL
jgi:hypothetical protein